MSGERYTPSLVRERDELAHCHSHNGSGIERAFPEEVGTCFAMEKLRGNDFWVGAIGAAPRLQRKEIGREISSLEQNVEV